MQDNAQADGFALDQLEFGQIHAVVEKAFSAVLVTALKYSIFIKRPFGLFMAGRTCSWFLLLCDSHLVTIRVLELKKLYA
jgi:hypothetical protein